MKEERIPFARKIKEHTAHLQIRTVELPETRTRPSEMELLFQAIERNVAEFAEFMNQFASTRARADTDLVSIFVQSPAFTWWASYTIWLRRHNGQPDAIVTTFVEPSGAESLPFAVTREKTSFTGDTEFAAWAELDLVCQSIVLLLGKPQA